MKFIYKCNVLLYPLKQYNDKMFSRSVMNMWYQNLILTGHYNINYVAYDHEQPNLHRHGLTFIFIGNVRIDAYFKFHVAYLRS